MHKQFLLVFIIIFNLSIYSQVVIKDEIILGDSFLSKDVIETTGIIIPMPYYGKIYSEIPCQWNHWTTGWIRKHRAAANQVWETGCWGASCPGQCFCSWPSTDGWWFYDVPALTDFVINIQRCYNGQLLDVPLSYEYIGNDKYNLYGVDLSDGSIDYIGFFRFYPTTPPPCCLMLDGPCAILCPEPFNPPALEITKESDPNICNEISDPVAGAFKGLYWNLKDGEELSVEPCQSPSTGEIKFKYATNFTNNIYVPYNLELCPDKVAYLNLRRIDDMSSFEDYLSEIRPSITLEQACNIRKQIINHKGIDENENQTEYEFLSENGIWLTAHSLAHEEEHRCDYENEINNAKHIFDEFYSNYSVPCSTYKPDPENAKLVAEGWYKSKLIDFSHQAQLEYNSKLDEVEVNGRDDVLNSIKPYLTRFDKFCRDKWGDNTYWNTIILCN